MRTIEEVHRFPSPAPAPQALFCDGATLWMSSRTTQRVYAIDRETWTVREEHAAPGTPYGMTRMGASLRVLCGEPPDDRRIIRTLVPGTGFTDAALAAPDDTGSQLSFDGERLYVSQWYNRRLLALDEDGSVTQRIDVAHGICGQVFTGGVFYLATTDDEESNDYLLTRVDPRGATSIAVDLAKIPFPARALAYDGDYLWTNHRAASEIVAFRVPS